MGAESKTVLPFAFIIFIIALRVVVFPVPGPPVRTSIPSVSAIVIAFFCKSAYSIPSSFSHFSIALSMLLIFSDGNLSNIFILDAMYISQRWTLGGNTNFLPSILSSISERSNSISSMHSETFSPSIPRKSVETFSSFSFGRQV